MIKSITPLFKTQIYAAGFYAGELQRRRPNTDPLTFCNPISFCQYHKICGRALLKRVVKVTDSNMLAQLVKIDVFFSHRPPRLGEEKRFTAV